MTNVRCFGCKAFVPAGDGPTHRYMLSAPGCWRLYGDVLAREYSDPAYSLWHRLTVDSYAVQHPGKPSRQSIQSVCVHLMSLCLVLERGLEPAHATRMMGEAVKKKDRFSWLEPPESVGSITVVDIVPLTDPDAHNKAVRRWAESAWSAWGTHHGLVMRWLDGGS